MNDRLICEEPVEMPLSDYQHFKSSDFDAIKTKLCMSIAPHKLRLLDRNTPINASINRAPYGNLLLQAMRVGPTVEVLPLTLGSCYLIHMPVNGRTKFTVNKKEFESTDSVGAVMSPGSQIQSLWERNCSAILVKIDSRLVCRHLERILGYKPSSEIRFSPALNLTSAGGIAWRRVWNYILLELESKGTDPFLYVRSIASENLLITTLLTSVANNYSDKIAEKVARSEKLPAYFVHAEKYMKLHAATPPTVSEIAKVAGVTTRTLHKAFARYRGVCPQKALLKIRLEAAHFELLMGGSDMTVTEVATRWGFFELGRFADKYKKHFGELPSSTLGRSARQT